MAEKKRKSSKKRNKKTTETVPASEKIMDSIKSVLSEPCIPNQFEDNISLYEKENVDLLETVDAIEYDRTQFQQDFPHLTAEIDNTKLNYPMDAVRWEDEECAEPLPPRPEEPTVESLLRRSKTKEEAIQIIKYLEKQGEINNREASQFLSKLKSKGLKAFQK